MRQHRFIGPRREGSHLLRLAAALFVEVAQEDGAWVATVTTRNAGAGHRLPTGEPLRSVLLTVDAQCDEAPLEAIGGDALPVWAGALERRAAGEDWSVWATAEAGDQIQVVRRTGAWHDYAGFGPFGDGRFDAEAKGLPVEHVVGSAVLNADGRPDEPLPEGDFAYRLRGDGPRAGRAGVAFARVLAGTTGDLMVPHHAAVDVVSDNRLAPQQSWVSTHRFEGACETPTITARLWHRPYPLGLGQSRGWPKHDQLMFEVRR
jgi:hypothetical protein